MEVKIGHIWKKDRENIQKTGYSEKEEQEIEVKIGHNMEER